MNVVLMSNAIAPDKLGGLERYVRELAEGLAAHDISVTVVVKCREGEGSLGLEKTSSRLWVYRYAVPSRSSRTFAYRYPFAVVRGSRDGLKIAKARAGSDRLVMHIHFAVPALYALITRKQFIYTFHAPVHKELPSERRGSYVLMPTVEKLAILSLRALERAIVRRASTVITLSEFMASQVSDLAGDSAAELELIQGGIDTNWFCPSSLSNGKRATSGRPVLLTARRLVPRTGVDKLVRAMPEILEKLPTARLVILGDGPQRADIERLVEELHLEDSVSLQGRVSEEALRDWYRAVDIAVTPTASLEGFGLSTAEAMATGCVPLVTPIGANPELVRSISPLLITDGADPKSLANGVVRLFTSREFSSFSDLVHMASRSYSWDSVIARHIELYGVDDD